MIKAKEEWLQSENALYFVLSKGFDITNNDDDYVTYADIENFIINTMKMQISSKKLPRELTVLGFKSSFAFALLPSWLVSISDIRAGGWVGPIGWRAGTAKHASMTSLQTPGGGGAPLVWGRNCQIACGGCRWSALAGAAQSHATACPSCGPPQSACPPLKPGRLGPSCPGPWPPSLLPWGSLHPLLLAWSAASGAAASEMAPASEALQVPQHYEIWNYYQSTVNVHAQALESSFSAQCTISCDRWRPAPSCCPLGVLTLSFMWCCDKEVLHLWSFTTEKQQGLSWTHEITPEPPFPFALWMMPFCMLLSADISDFRHATSLQTSTADL